MPATILKREIVLTPRTWPSVRRGYQVWVRTTIAGGAEWFKQLRHSFLLVEGDPKFPDQLYVVDPNFRDQFVIARQTAQYQRVTPPPPPPPQTLFSSPTVSAHDICCLLCPIADALRLMYFPIQVMQSVPQVFVGRGKKLLPAVQLLCAEMSAAFSQQQLEVPPGARINPSCLSGCHKRRRTMYPNRSPANFCSMMSHYLVCGPLSVISWCISSEQLSSTAVLVCCFSLNRIRTQSRAAKPLAYSLRSPLCNLNLKPGTWQCLGYGLTPTCTWAIRANVLFWPHQKSVVYHVYHVNANLTCILY